MCEDKGEKIHVENMKKMRQYTPRNLVSLVRALLIRALINSFALIVVFDTYSMTFIAH
jgi:hypothetical protein